MKVVEFYALWLAALESGEYPQAKGALRTPEGFCCLGVAGDVLVKTGLFLVNWEESNFGFELVVSLKRGSYSSYGNLSFVLQDKLRLRPNLGEERREDFTVILPHMNDEQRKTFPEIAAFIRQEILPKIDPDLELELK